MKNGKWVKTFIQSESQVNVTCVADKLFGYKTTARVLIGGDFYDKELYKGDNLDKASNALESFGRGECAEFVANCTGKKIKPATIDEPEGSDFDVDGGEKDSSPADSDIPDIPCNSETPKEERE